MQLLASYSKANDQDKAECQNKLTKARGIVLRSVSWIGIFSPVWVSSRRDNLFFNVHKTGFYRLQLQEFDSSQYIDWLSVKSYFWKLLVEIVFMTQWTVDGCFFY